jgi:hypothetical protein
VFPKCVVHLNIAYDTAHETGVQDMSIESLDICITDISLGAAGAVLKETVLLAVETAVADPIDNT